MSTPTFSACPPRRRPARAGGCDAGFRFGAVLDQHAQQRQRDHQAEAVAERLASAIDRLAGAAAAQSQGGGDLRVAEPFQLAHHDRSALRLRQVAQPPHQLRDLLAPLRLLRGRAATAVVLLDQLRRVGRLVAQVVERRVADDPVEPRLQVDLRVRVAPQRQQSLREGVLGDVLRAPADDRPRVTGQRLAVAADDLLERRVVAVADEGDQPPVGLGAQRRTEEESGGESLCGWWIHRLCWSPGLLI